MTRGAWGILGMVAVGMVALGVVVGAGRAADREPAVPEGTKVVRDLEYVRGGHARQKLDLYLPPGAKGRLPVVVWIHGGAWRGGSKDGGGPAVGQVARGYAVAAINYRLSQHAPFPAQIEDCKAAIRWLRGHAREYNLDPGRIAVWGASAGGHLAALLGTSGGVQELEGKLGDCPEQSSRVQAVVDWFGPTDLANMGGAHDDAQSPESLLLGGPVPRHKDRAVRASPVTYVSKDDPPFLVLHGDKDPLVPVGQSELLAEALKKAGVEAVLVKIPGAGHGGQAFQSPVQRKLVDDFLDRVLRPKAVPAKPAARGRAAG